MTETSELPLQLAPAGSPVRRLPRSSLPSPTASIRPRPASWARSRCRRGRLPDRTCCSFDLKIVDMQEILERLDRIETALATLIEQRTIKEWYSTDEVATILEKAPFTVREWCRLGRIHADKRACGRGNTQEWMISHDELTRVRNEGLLPVITKYKHYR